MVGPEVPNVLGELLVGGGLRRDLAEVTVRQAIAELAATLVALDPHVLDVRPAVRQIWAEFHMLAEEVEVE